METAHAARKSSARHTRSNPIALRWLLGTAAASMLVATACRGPVFVEDALPVDQGCVALRLSSPACDGLVTQAKESLSLTTDQIVETDVLTEDRCGDRRQELCTRTSGFLGGVLFRLADGRILWTTIVCLPGTTNPMCLDRP